MHQRTAIRNYVVQTLLDASTAAGTNVSSNVTTPHWRSDLPAITVYSQTEEIEEFNKAPKDLKRTLKLAVEIYATNTENNDLQDELDDIAKEVEDALSIDDSLGGNCEYFTMSSCELNFKGDGDQPIAVCRILYDVIYITYTPETLISQTNLVNLTDAAGANIEWDIGHDGSEADGQIDAEDTINLETL